MTIHPDVAAALIALGQGEALGLPAHQLAQRRERVALAELRVLRGPHQPHQGKRERERRLRRVQANRLEVGRLFARLINTPNPLQRWLDEEHNA